MKVFISGSKGFIGSNLTSYLSNFSCYELFDAFGSWKDKYDGGNVIDIGNFKELRFFIGDRKPDLFINLAIRKGSDYCDLDIRNAYRSNIIGMKNVIDLCNEFNIPLIHFGTTSYYYSDESKTPISETSLIAPRTFYGVSKLVQEYLLRNLANFKWMIIEPVFIYGNALEFNSGRVESVPDIIMRLSLNDYYKDSEEVKIDPQYIKDYTHIKDLVWMVEKVINKPAWGEKVLVGAGFNQSLNEICGEIISDLGFKIKFLKKLDYKKNQVHDYTKLNSLYPEWTVKDKINLREFFRKAGEL
ncbi:MAG: NAD(P)-dependent oxidoreductase [Patescibacteria group bacterium]